MRSNKINICFLLGSVNTGGTEMLSLDICNNFKHKDFTVMLAYRQGGDLESEFRKTNIKMFKLSSKRNNYFQIIKNLRKLVIENEISIIHANQPLDAILAKCAIRKLKIKIVLTHHGFLRQTISKILINWAITCADLNIYVSQSCRKIYENYLVKDLSKKSTILYNGVDLNRLTLNITNRAIDDKILRSNFKMGMVGSFHPSTRNQLNVCKALALVHANKKDFIFVFAGGASIAGAEYMKNCIEECESSGLKNKVLFTGTIDYVPSLLKHLDAYVYSTNSETFGISVVEAMILGLPTIINDHPTLLEISNNGKCGLVYKTGNETDLADKIIFLMNKPNARFDLATKSKIYAIEKFSIENHISNLLRLYKNLLSSN